MSDVDIHPRRDAFLDELLAEHALRAPDRPAIIHSDGNLREQDGRPRYSSVDYGEFAARVTACAAGLARRGVGRGTRTAVLVPPGADLLTLVFAMMRIGAVPVVVDPGMGLNRMLACIHAVGVQAFVGVPSAHFLRRLRPGAFAGVRSLITVGSRDGSGLRKLVAPDADQPPLPSSRPVPDDLALISYTTGSTGPAKPVAVTGRMLRGMALSIEEGHYTSDIRTTLLTLALIGLFDLAAGRTVVVPRMNMGAVGSVDPALLTDAIQRFSVNAMFASPAVLGPLEAHLGETGARVPSLHLVISGGAPVKPELMAALRVHLPDRARVFSTYGSTEALPMTLIESREALELAYGPASGMGVCVGRPAPGTSIRTIAISDRELPEWNDLLQVAPGQMGEIVVSGEAVSPRYYQAPDADAGHKIQDGERRWHRTGDIGWIDRRGRVWFCGRKSHRVRAAGGDLHTVRCESVFNVHPQVARTALVGVGRYGEQRPVLCVELVSGTSLAQWPRIEGELRALGAANAMSKPIEDFLPHPRFPVDIRHNAKIRRELLVGWAQDQLAEGRRTTAAHLALRTVPLIGWAFLAAYPLQSHRSDLLTAMWWLDAVLSVAVHAAQIPRALRAEQGRATGRRPAATAALTMLFGATWWKPRSHNKQGATA